MVIYHSVTFLSMIPSSSFLELKDLFFTEIDAAQKVCYFGKGFLKVENHIE